MEKYSVLMSLYAKEKKDWLELAIESMIHQTVPPDEILIVKDGPITDQLQNVLDEFELAYPGLFTIIGYKENKGLGYALNFGLKHIKNDLVARMDTDDISLPGRCEEQLHCFAQFPDLDIVGGDIEEFTGNVTNAVARRTVPAEQNRIEEFLKYRCPFNHMSVMYRRSSVQAAGGYQDWFWNEDYYLWIRMYLHHCQMANTGTVLVHVRVGGEMYKRRGGIRYFKSEAELQKYMLDHKVIGLGIYSINILKRFIVQVLLPNSIRGWVFRNFARRKIKNYEQ